ncbi:MAG: 23S rRNA (uracil(1939)-C(5))-methyltransferase RlmD [Lachnospiraceae bacterium]|nr:23S rRNA (uracil(1939)-C(5))-methyltransferase RlmD [Lachnospiraceae bacterium]
MKMFRKNQEVELTIEDLGSSGEGIGKVDGFTVFVKDTVIGDVVRVKLTKVKKNYAFARLVEVIKPSENRVEPACPVARACGGCQLQMMSYAEQLRYKSEKVYNNIKRIGGTTDFKMREIIGMEEPFHYRNKAQFPVGLNRDGEIVYGFYAGRTHSIISCDSCMLGINPNGVDINSKIMSIIKSFMEDHNITAYDEESHKGLVRHVLIRIGAKTGQIMVCVVINGTRLPFAEELVHLLKNIEGMTNISYNINTEKSNVILGTEVVDLYGSGYIEDYIGDVKFRISALSFFQVNPEQTEKLYGRALECAGLTGNETVWDLYCGIGSISLFLARKAKKVIGVEIVPQAIEDAKINAQINDIDNAEFLVGAAEEVVPSYFEENQNAAECKPDVIVVDPPRKGCDEKLLNTVVRMAPKKVVYVSCDSATLGRDVKWLEENGYKLVEATPVDMFGQSVHVETVALLYQMRDDSHFKHICAKW